MSVKLMLAASVSFLDYFACLCVCGSSGYLSCNHPPGGVSRATLGLPGNLTSGLELSQLRSEVLCNGLSKLCLFIWICPMKL